MSLSWNVLLGLAALSGAADKPEAAPGPPPPTITLYDRHAQVTPTRMGFEHTGGGNIDVAQPSPDVVVITMTGVAVAGPHPCKDSVAAQDFELEQCFEVGVDKPAERKLKLTVETRVIGLLRSHHKGSGTAQESAACATLLCGPEALATLCAPPHSVAGGENLSVNDHCGPVAVPVGPGRFTLHETFHISVTQARALCGKTSSAEFAPDPALDPLWISYF